VLHSQARLVKEKANFFLASGPGLPYHHWVAVLPQKQEQPMDDANGDQKWVDELSDDLDSSTIKQQVEAMVCLVDEIQANVFLLSLLARKLKAAAHSDVLNDAESEASSAAVEKLRGVLKTAQAVFGPRLDGSR
jgi:hypothetical protein